MNFLLKGLKTAGLLGIIGGLCFASSVFTVMAYMKITGVDAAGLDSIPQDEINPSHIQGEGETSASLTEEIVQESAIASLPLVGPTLPDPVDPIKDKVMLEAPLVLQYPELPRGCEVTSLTMLLQFAGKDVEKMGLSEQMIRDTTPIEYAADGSIAYWGHPSQGFVGEITRVGPGFGVYHEALLPLLAEYVDQPLNLSGLPFEELERQLSRGIPVVVWTTTIHGEPNKWVEWDTPMGTIKTTFQEHAALMVGYDEQYIYINDPLQSVPQYKVDRASFIHSWEIMGKQALSYALPAVDEENF